MNAWLCCDCTLAGVNGDYSGMDPGTAARVFAAVSAYPGRLAPNWDSDSGAGVREFSKAPCDCCATPLAGHRFRFST